MTNEDTTQVAIQDSRLRHIHFTGSVKNGQLIQRALSISSAPFRSLGLELGGKDPAYVRNDVDVKRVAEEIADGAFFNSGQSCCGLERVYVHHSIYDAFVDELVRVAESYTLGDPMKQETTLGPVISQHAATLIRQHIQDAIQRGAKQRVDLSKFPADDVRLRFPIFVSYPNMIREKGRL